MNRTFGFLAIGLLALSLLASCKKENGSENNAPKDGFVALMEQTDKAGNNNRTHINPSEWNSGEQPNVLWTADDLIRVQNAKGTTLPYQLTEGETKTHGIFYTGEPHDGFLESSPFNAIYPASNVAGVANTISGNTATFNLPATQTYKANSFAEGSIPMVAHSTTQTLSFKNVLGCICFPLAGANRTVTKIVLTSKTGSEKLWGVFTADCTSNDPIPSYKSDGGGGNSITLDCSANGGVTLSSTPTYFCISVPPGTMQSGFTVKIYNGESIIYQQRTISAMPENLIQRSRIRLIKSMDISMGFSVEEGRHVLFAPGNLQWSAKNGGTTPTTHAVADGGTAAGTWRFAENQWDIIGSDNANISQTYEGWIDIFGWATSGYNEKNPYMTSKHNSDYGDGSNDIAGTYYDWGVYNDIYNPSTESTDPYGTWRLLTADEWKYVIEQRSTKSGKRFAKANVHGINGLLLVPDNWNTATYTLNNYDVHTAAFNSNVISDTDVWETLENAGCVFLPAAGYREEKNTDYSIYPMQVNEYGYYWSSTPAYVYDQGSTHSIRYHFFNEGTSNSQSNYYGNRYRGESVRLAKDI